MGCVELERRFADAVSSFLTGNGYEVKIRGPWEFAFGGVEVIRLHENGWALLTRDATATPSVTESENN